MGVPHLRHSRSRGLNSVPDYGFGRCDGHHEMVDLRLRQRFNCASFAKTTPPRCVALTGPLSGTRHAHLGEFLSLTGMSLPRRLDGRCQEGTG
jgi:hypothetical protein